MHWVYHLLCQTATPEKANAFWTAIQGIGTMAAAIGAAVAAGYAVATYRAQTKQVHIQADQLNAQVKQSKTELWRSMSKEFDHDMAEARGRCGLHYIICVEASDKAQDNMTSVPDGAKLEMTIFQPVMDYFDTLGYLLRNSLVEEQLTRETFRYYFAGYFMATESFLREKQKEAPTFYENVFFLNKAWGKDPSLNSTRDLEIFFKGERARGK